jgi:hypothetical protein
LLAESMAESASMKTTPTASDSELGGPGYIDDDDYKPDQVTINTERFLNYKWMVFQKVASSLTISM